jgi:uncharacterized protein YerC
MRVEVVHESQQRRNDAWIGEREQALFEAFTYINNVDEARDFLIDLFTVGELQKAAKRWCVVGHLFEGKKQREASQLCGNDKNTATRVNTSILKLGTGMSRIIYDRMNHPVNE